MFGRCLFTSPDTFPRPSMNYSRCIFPDCGMPYCPIRPRAYLSYAALTTTNCSLFFPLENQDHLVQPLVTSLCTFSRPALFRVWWFRLIASPGRPPLKWLERPLRRIREGRTKKSSRNTPAQTNTQNAQPPQKTEPPRKKKNKPPNKKQKTKKNPHTPSPAGRVFFFLFFL